MPSAHASGGGRRPRNPNQKQNCQPQITSSHGEQVTTAVAVQATHATPSHDTLLPVHARAMPVRPREAPTQQSATAARQQQRQQQGEIQWRQRQPAATNAADLAPRRHPPASQAGLV